MEDLADLQVKTLESIFESDDCDIVEHEDLIAEAANQISEKANSLRHTFAHLRRNPTHKADHEWLIETITEIIKWTTTLFYTFEEEPPEIADLIKFANSFEPEIAADGILNTLQMQRSISDFALMTFTEEEVDQNELEMCAVEILCCAELLLRRYGSSIQELITDL